MPNDYVSILLTSYEEKREQWLQEIAVLALDIAYKIVHVLTGLLRSTLAVKVTSETVELSYNTDYALYEELRYHTLQNALSQAVTITKAKYGI